MRLYKELGRSLNNNKDGRNIVMLQGSNLNEIPKTKGN